MNPILPARCRVVAALVARLAGVAWALATFFVVPVLAFEGLGPEAALRRSAALVRERWGEGVGGAAAIATAVVVVGALPALALVAVAAAIGGTVVPIALGAVAAALVVAAAVTGAALSAIFRVVVYGFARDGRAVAGFERAELAAAFGAV